MLFLQYKKWKVFLQYKTSVRGGLPIQNKLGGPPVKWNTRGGSPQPPYRGYGGLPIKWNTAITVCPTNCVRGPPPGCIHLKTTPKSLLPAPQPPVRRGW